MTDCVDGLFTGKRFVILDRYGKLTAQFKGIPRDAGVTPVITGYQAPNMNASASWALRTKASAMSPFGNAWAAC